MAYRRRSLAHQSDCVAKPTRCPEGGTNTRAGGTDASTIDEPGGAHLRYRPYIDGLRAVAVYLVLAFHSGLDLFRGGFIGVDVFFVLSGFLVTSILIRDLARGGRVRAGRFYARRVRRILPAAFVTLIVTALAFAAVASPAEVLEAAGGFKAAFLYVEEHQRDWYRRVIPELDPDLVILSHQAFDNPDRPYRFRADGTSVLPGTPELERALAVASSASLRELLRDGRMVVLIEPTPDAPRDADPLLCLSRGGDPADCRYPANPDPTPLERFYREQARRPRVTTLDLDRLVCPRWPICDAVVDDVIVKRDLNHLTATFARSLAEQVARQLPR